METIELIIRIVFSLNVCALTFAYIMMNKRYEHIEDKLNRIATQNRIISIDEITVLDDEMYIRIGNTVTSFKLNDVKKLLEVINKSS